MELPSDTEASWVGGPAQYPTRHPKGLWVLAGTEFWDRVSWHGMVSMLVLYMTGELLAPSRIAHVAGWGIYYRAITALSGPLSDTAIATTTFSIYFAAVSFLPLVGGWLGDRVISRRIAVALGALIMTLGHFLMAFDTTFLAALLALVVGAGLIRGNLASQIRSLYGAGDRKIGEGFQFYNLAVCLGAFIAPLACGTVAKYYGWHAGFAVAGFGMLAGLAWYIVGSRHLLPLRAPRVAPVGHPPRHRQLTRQDRRNIASLAVIWPFCVVYFISQAQIWNVYNLWVRDHVTMTVGSFAVPVPWLQSLDGLAPAAFIPLIMALFRVLARHNAEPGTLTKLGIGSAIFGGGMMVLAAAPLFSGPDGRAPLWLPVLFHLISNFGAMFFVPFAAAFFTGRAPEGLRGTLYGGYALSVTVASLVSGPMGAWYDHVSPPLFWTVSAAFSGLGGLLLLVIAKPLDRWMGPESDAETA